MNSGKQNSHTAPSVAIIILNWNGWEDTIECLESVHQIDYPNYSVIVIDNASTNESIKKIKSYAKGKITVRSKYLKHPTKNKPIMIMEFTDEMTEAFGESSKSKRLREFSKLEQNKRLILIKNQENYGFAKGNNIGMKFALKALNPDYILLLNNDTAVKPDFLTKMVQAGEAHKRVGIIGPKIPYYDLPTKNWFCKGIINWFSINIAYHKDTCEGKGASTDYITGCAALIKKDVIEKIGYLDEKLFLYFEDADYSLRAKAAKFDLLVAPTATVYHKVSATSYGFILSKAQYYFSRNRLWFVKKYCPKNYLRLSQMFIFLRLFLAIGFFALKRKRSTVTAILEAYRDGMKTSY